MCSCKNRFAYCKQSPEVQMKEDGRPCLSPFLLPSLYLHSVSHTHCIHPPCPGESPCQCSILTEMLSYSSPLTEESKTRWYNEAGICCWQVNGLGLQQCCNPHGSFVFSLPLICPQSKIDLQTRSETRNQQPGFPQSPNSQGQSWDAGFYLGAVNVCL